jgi:hypothetical protein
LSGGGAGIGGLLVLPHLVPLRWSKRAACWRRVSFTGSRFNVLPRLLCLPCFSLPTWRHFSGAARIAFVHGSTFYSGLAGYGADSIRILRRQGCCAGIRHRLKFLHIEHSRSALAGLCASNTDQLLPVRVE